MGVKMKNLKTTLCGLLLIGGQLPYSLMGVSTPSPQEKNITLRTKKMQRDYQTPVTKAEKKDLSYIIKALGFDSLPSLLKEKSSLKKAGERIEHIHPFRFLETVFKNEELKAGIHAIRDRGKWVWGDFVEGLTGSLNEEANRQNLMQYTSDFAKNLRFSEERILPYLQQKKWTEFVNVLIDEIPREINPDRYDM